MYIFIIGMDDDQLKNGCSMVIDPFGDILGECRQFDDAFVTVMLAPEKLRNAGGHRYINARRPDLYRDVIGKAHESTQTVVWLHTGISTSTSAVTVTSTDDVPGTGTNTVPGVRS